MKCHKLFYLGSEQCLDALSLQFELRSGGVGGTVVELKGSLPLRWFLEGVDTA